MSDATAPKKSILTDAMEKVQAKMNAETAEQESTEKKSFLNKKNVIKVGIAATAATAAIVALKLFTGQSAEEETEEDNTED